jgi:restriction system protein
MDSPYDALNAVSWRIVLMLWPIWGTLAILVGVRLVVALYQAQRLARSGIAEVDRMDGITFERYLEQLFRRLGYQVERTRAAEDYGADLIIARDGMRTAVQAKRHAKNVGGKSVQEAVAAQRLYRCTRSMVVTNQGYTRQARKLARANAVVLWGREQLVAAALQTQRQRGAR